MDLLQRLIAGSGSATSKQQQQQQRVLTPNERFSVCKRLCNTLQSVWRSSTSTSNDDSASNHVSNILQRLNNILEEESRKAAPHSCLVYTATNQIYIIVAKLAISSSNHEVVHFAVRFFHFLINGGVEGILDSKIFARSVIDLTRKCTAPATKVVDQEGESALIELLFEVCIKIRLDPDILPAWFYPERGSSQTPNSVSAARQSQFPLFYLLVDYVHYDGPIGDFARTGLLYLTEIAARSRSLEIWMMESDLAPQMASGLSALYGRLSRSVSSISKVSLPILCYSDASDSFRSDELHDNADSDMRAFLSYLAFWQDTLTHCKSLEVRDTLLDAFQALFVEQLLYPSLLESSDVEGGSTAAVILHLCQLLDALEQPQLVRRMLNYLFAWKAQPLPKNHKTRPRMSLSRRRSMEHLASIAQLADNPSPNLFSLQDLIVFSLRSSQYQTITSALKLVTVLLRRHHPYVKTQLLFLMPLEFGVRQNLNGLNHTMMTLFDYAGAISHNDKLDTSYQAALTDVQIAMEQHSCLFDQDLPIDSEKDTMRVSRDCKVLGQMFSLLESWFTNDTLVNLELTSAFAGLSACGNVLMITWLSSMELGGGVAAILERLTQQVATWRSQFVEWDVFCSIHKAKITKEDDMVDMPTANTGSVDSGPQRHSTEHDNISNDSSGTPSATLSATLLETRIPIEISSGRGPATDSTARPAESDHAGESEQGDSREQSLRHILTQAIILQEFILELAAALQIRATLFDEVDLS